MEFKTYKFYFIFLHINIFLISLSWFGLQIAPHTNKRKKLNSRRKKEENKFWRNMF